MKKCTSIIACMALAISSHALAGIHSFTMHSRANCVNNESISWWLFHKLLLRTRSLHNFHGRYHVVDTGWHATWRSAAVHWGEGTGGWFVTGYHYISNGRTARLIRDTKASNCNIYDGWWDY
jgi:hypothetical protein